MTSTGSRTSLGEAKDLYRRVPQQWRRLCRTVKAIPVGSPAAEVSQSVSQSSDSEAESGDERPDSSGVPPVGWRRR